MPRIRTIKPSFFKSEDVSVLPFRARLTWVGLWTHCDDQGRTKDNARLIKGDVWPLDEVSLKDIEEDLETLAGHGRIVRYQVNGQRYLEITNWSDHQRIQKPTPSRIPPSRVGPKEATPVDSSSEPAPQSVDNPRSAVNGQATGTSDSATGALPDDSGSPTGGKGREGKGKEGEGKGNAGARADDPAPPAAPPAEGPPSKCEKHINDPDPPRCGGCADARKARNHWEMERARRVGDAPKCRKHRGQLAANCAPCRSERIEAGSEEAP